MCHPFGECRSFDDGSIIPYPRYVGFANLSFRIFFLVPQGCWEFIKRNMCSGWKEFPIIATTTSLIPFVTKTTNIALECSSFGVHQSTC